RDAHEGIRLDDGGEQALPFHQRNAAKVIAVKIEKVESEVRDWISPHTLLEVLRIGSDARLDVGEAGPAFFIEGHDFSVYDRLLGAQRIAEGFELRIVFHHRKAGATEGADFLFVDETESSYAVPFHFK